MALTHHQEIQYGFEKLPKLELSHGIFVFNIVNDI